VDRRIIGLVDLSCTRIAPYRGVARGRFHGHDKPERDCLGVQATTLHDRIQAQAYLHISWMMIALARRSAAHEGVKARQPTMCASASALERDAACLPLDSAI
jgi:hypothetical protein